MKKTILILVVSLVTMVGMLLTGCGGSSDGGDGTDYSDSNYVGTWKATDIAFADESADVEEEIGEWTITLNADGTGTMVAVDEEGTEETSELKWEPTDEGFKTTGDAKLKFTDQGDSTVQANMFGVDLTFKKQ